KTISGNTTRLPTCGMNFQMLLGSAMKTLGHSAVCAIALCVMTACRPVPDSTVNFAHRVEDDCRSRTGEELYFDGVFPRNEPRTKVATAYYVQLLAAMNEPSLGCGGTFDEAYRILWSPALNPRSVMIRAARAGMS